MRIKFYGLLILIPKRKKKHIVYKIIINNFFYLWQTKLLKLIITICNKIKKLAKYKTLKVLNIFSSNVRFVLAFFK